MSNIDALQIRQVLGRHHWSVPAQFGADGWELHRTDEAHMIVTCAPYGDTEWIHASMSLPDRVPTYQELKRLHRAVFGDGWSYQVFAPPNDHINLHEHCLHLWGRLDGKPVLPDFSCGTGMI